MTLMRKMLQRFKLPAVCLFALAAWSQSASAGTPKLDKDTCTQLRGEQANFVQTGILADLQRGPEWAKTNLGAPRLRDIEHFIALDEQLKFGCREATLTPDAMRAGEEALKIEANPDVDPNAPAPAGAAFPPADASGVNAAPGDAGATPPAEADAPKAPAKPRVRHKPTAHPKPKPSKDAFTPPPGTESTLQPPAPTEQTPKAPAVEAR